MSKTLGFSMFRSLPQSAIDLDREAINALTIAETGG